MKEPQYWIILQIIVILLKDIPCEWAFSTSLRDVWVSLNKYFLINTHVLIMNSLMVYIMICWSIMLVKIHFIVCIDIYLKTTTLIKVEVKCFYVHDLIVVLTSILVYRIAHIIGQKRNIKIYYDNDSLFNLHMKGNLVKLSMIFISN